MGRINKTNKATPVSADEFIIYDSEDTSDDKNVTLGQIAAFTESQDTTVTGTKIFADGVQFEKGNVAFGQYTPFPTTVGSYVASYVSPVYGPRILGYNGSAYQDLSIGSMPTAGTISMKSLANGDCDFGYNVNIAEDLGVTGDINTVGDISANKFIGDGSELTNIAGALKTEALGTVTSDITLKDGYVSTAHTSGTFSILLPTTLATGIENVSVFDFTNTSTSQPTITSSRNLTGTCAVTNGDATVTGTGTLFLTELEVGSKVTIATVDYQVLSIASNTSLELTVVYAGTTASGLTVGHKFIKWSSLNGGKAPTAYSVISGVRNILVFKTHNSGVTWEAEYSTFGGVETAWTRPNLSAYGTLGGSYFAVSYGSTWEQTDGHYVWKAVDGSGSTFSSQAVVGANFIFYNPIPIKVSQLQYINNSGEYASALTLYGSNNNSNWTTIQSFSGLGNSYPSYTTLSINESNREFYKYYKMVITAGASYFTMYELGITATYMAT